MSQYFSEARCVQLSTLNHIKDRIDAFWTGINVVETYEEATQAALPVISVRLLPINSTGKEIGSTAWDNTYNIVVDIFAKSNGQRIDLAYFILDKIKDGWSYFIYSNNPNNRQVLLTTLDGKLNCRGVIENVPIEFAETVAEKDKCRHILSFLVKRTK